MAVMPSNSSEYKEKRRKKKNKRKRIRNKDYLERRRQKLNKRKDHNNRSRERNDDYLKRQKQRLNNRKDHNNRSRERSDDYLKKKRDKDAQNRSEDYLERKSKSLAKYRQDYGRLVENYETSIREGPTVICNSCGGLFFSNSISRHSTEELIEEVGEELFLLINQVMSSEYIQLCITCSREVKRKNIPKLCLFNGLKFPEVPEELKDLTTLEKRLVSPRLPFMQIRELGIDKQFGIKGNVVNVPIDIQKSVDVLPRSFDKTETIQLKLKRMRVHKSDYLNEYIRPFQVMRAAEYLIQQPLYVEEGINISSDWAAIHNIELEKFIVLEDDKNDSELEIEAQELKDEWDETADDPNLNPGTDETLLKQGLEFAPGEGVIPISLLSDKYAEELSFPTIYCGQERQCSDKLSYADIVKSELRRYDRRCCDVSKLFFMYRKKETIALKNAITTHLRKGNVNQNLTAGQALSSEFMDKLINSDEAYKVLAKDRSSPAYWNARMKDLMAMIRQLGVPTFFLTLSAAETHWTELLVMLAKVVQNREITEEEAQNMPYIDKCNLIRSDPVTCSRYFEHRFRELFKLIKAVNGPFGKYKVVDYYIRIEFQHRGSPHVHCLIWLENAPIYDPNIPETKIICEEFIGEFITCSTAEYKEIEANLSKYQYHKHSKSCKRFREDSAVCRFGIPFYPMRKTSILDPLDMDDLSDETYELLEYCLEKIEERIEEIDTENRKSNGAGIQVEFDQFLQELRISEDEYILAIRSTLKRSEVFLKRSPIDIRINAFNREILQRHRANMDLQFVLDPYACVHYILNYINKSNRGMSALLRQVVDESKSGYISHQQRLNKICSMFLNCSEVSSQEAVYILLSMPLSQSSRSTIFINTGEKDKRTRILKTTKELEEIDPNSNDIMASGLLEFYILRPEELDDICLAVFASMYEYSKTKKSNIVSDINEDLVDNQDINSTQNNIWKLKDNKGWVRKRRVPKIIRYRRYQFEKDPDLYYREKVMLYVPYRDEDLEIIGSDCRQKYMENKCVIEELEKLFVFDPSHDYEKIQRTVEDNMSKEFIDEEESEDTCGELVVHDLQRIESDIAQEFGGMSLSNNPRKGLSTGPKLIVEDQYLSILRLLNVRQRKYLHGMMNIVKTSTVPFHHFVTGGAGTGKSLLISAIYQSLVRYLNFRYQNPDKVKVLLLGPTGKSAFNIGGTTIHTGLGIPVSANNKETNLRADTKNTMRTKFWYLKVIIIDEISMVGASTLKKINHQLKQIFNSQQDFGGISMIFFGDFNQLKPVMDSYIFDSSKCGYSVVAGICLWSLFKIYKLTEIMRQKDDLPFAQALNHLAIGQLDEQDIQLFESRRFEKTDSCLPQDAIRLFPTNEQVDRYNRLVIERSPEHGYQSIAMDFPATCMNNRMRNQALYVVSFMTTQETYGLPELVILKPNIRYMITTNIDIEDGLVNGTSGILKEIDKILKNGREIPEILWFDFEFPNVGAVARSRMKPKINSQKYLTPVFRVVRDIQTKVNAKLVMVSRRQFPVVPSEAITIHKAQGQTYDKVVVDMSRKLEISKLYTGLSRAKTSVGLFIIGKKLKFEAKRDPGHAILKEMTRIEVKSSLKFKIDTIEDQIVDNSGSLRIFYQNLPYLAKHASDLESDQIIMASDILLLLETRANHVKISGYNLMAQIEYQNGRPFGTAIYARQNLYQNILYMGKDIIIRKDSHFEYLVISIKDLYIVLLYISPSFPRRESIEILTGITNKLKAISDKIITIGDYNINVLNESGKLLLDRMASIGMCLFPQLGSPTNDHNNQIDMAFSSFPIQYAGYYESLVSDHKPIFLKI